MQRQKRIETLHFISTRGVLRNPRTRKTWKLPLQCELRGVQRRQRRIPGQPCLAIARAEFKYRGRLYRVDFVGGRIGLHEVAMGLAREGSRRVVFYMGVSRYRDYAAYALLAKEATDD